MGTNYYHRTNICAACGRYDEHHIGKSSIGWTFSFHGEREPEPELNPLGGVVQSWQDWQLRLHAAGTIFNEYGQQINIEEFEKLIEAKKDAPRNHASEEQKHPDWGTRSWHDADGHSFSEREFS